MKNQSNGKNGEGLSANTPKCPKKLNTKWYTIWYKKYATITHFLKFFSILLFFGDFLLFFAKKVKKGVDILNSLCYNIKALVNRVYTDKSIYGKMAELV